LLTRLIFLLSLFLAGCAAATDPTADLPPELARGHRVYQIHCSSCHSLEPGVVITGPSLDGIATRAATRVEGQEAKVYITTAILNPRAFTTPGFSQLMPTTFGKTISEDDLDLLIAYLLTLK
jgi:mono/diheme cytochrome c family protein